MAVEGAEVNKKVSPETQNLRRPDLLADVEPVKDSYVPQGFDTQEDFLSDMREQYQADVDFDRINRFEAIDDLRFAAGEQWDPVVLQQRKGLPCLVINTIPQFTAQLVGDWRESQKAIKVVPSNNEDTDVASIRGDLIRNIEMQSRSARVYDSAFESMIQCGDGAFKVTVEYARDDVFDQDIFLRPVEDVLATVWDRFSVDPTGRDAKRCFVDDRIPKDEYNRKWPGAGGGSDLMDNDKIDRVSLAGWVDDDSYRVTEYWRMIERQKTMALFENGQMYEVDDTNIDDLLARLGPPVKTRQVWCRYAQMHYCTGFKILAGPYEYRLNRLPVIRMSGRVVNIAGRRVRYGLVRFMKDPARLKNFWRSIAAEQLGYSPKAQWLATQSAVEGRQEAFRKAHLTRDPLLIVNDEAVIGQNIQRIDPPAPQNAIFQEVGMNTQDMKDVSGIHDASLGIRSNETSGRAILTRQHEGDVASRTYYDNADQALLEAGDVINQLIPQIYDGTRVVRLVGQDEAVKFQRINDPMDPHSVDLGVGIYDVALTTGTSYTTRRVEAAQAMMEAIQVYPQLMQIAGDLVVKAQDWPGAEELSERLKKTIPPEFLDEDEAQDRMIPAAMVQQQAAEAQEVIQKLSMENQALKADKTIDFKKLEIDAYNAETKRIQALSQDLDAQAGSDKGGMELQALSKILDSSAEIDDLDLRRDELEHRMTMDRMNYEQKQTQLSDQKEIAEKTISTKASANTAKPAAKKSSQSKA